MKYLPSILVIAAICVLGAIMIFSQPKCECPESIGYVPGANTITKAGTHGGAVYASTTAGGIIGRNEDRQYAAVINDGTSTVYLCLATSTDSSVVTVAHKGIRLNANGGSFEILPDNHWIGEIWAITASGESYISWVDK